METLSKLKDGLLGFVSPAPKRQRLDEPSERQQPHLYSTGKVPSLETALPDVRRISMSPKTKTRQWLNRASHTSTASGISTISTRTPQRKSTQANVLRVRGAGISKSQIPEKKRFSLPSLSWLISPAVQAQEHADDDDNERTLVAIDEEEDEQAAQHGVRSPLLSPTSTAVNHDADEESEQLTPAQLAEQNTRKAFQSSDWTEPEIAIYRCLSMRGHEPLLPRHWAMDYPTFPSALFNRNHLDSLLGSLRDNDFRAQRAFTDLINLGSTVRSLIEAGINPEHKVKDAIRRYQKWAAWDGRYTKHEHLPMFVIVEPREAESTAALGELLAGKLRSLAERWREAYRIWPSVENHSKGADSEEYMASLPALIGVLLKGSVAGVVTYHAQGLTSQKSVAVFDFSTAHQDVWNALGIAMLVLHSRNWLAACLERGELEGEQAEDEEDIDA